MNWILVFGLVLSIGYAVPNVAQIIRTLKVKNSFGWNAQLVSAWFVSYIAWTLYSALVFEPLLAAANATGVIMTGLILFFLVKENKLSKQHMFGWLAWLILVLVLGIFLLPSLLVIMVTTVDIIFMIPQIFSLAKSKNAEGISVLYFGLSILLGVGWVVYSFIVGKPLLALYYYFGLPWNVWIFWRVKKIQKNSLVPN